MGVTMKTKIFLLFLFTIPLIAQTNKIIRESDLKAYYDSTYTTFGGTNLEPQLVVTPAQDKIVMAVDSVGMRGNLKVDGDIAAGYVRVSNSLLLGSNSLLIPGGLTIYNGIGGFTTLNALNGDYINSSATQTITGQKTFTNVIANGTFEAKSTVTFGNPSNQAYTFPSVDGAAGTVIKTDGDGNLYFSSDLTGGGGSAFADAVTHDGRTVIGDSLVTDAEGFTRYEPKGVTISDVTLLQDSLTKKLNRADTLSLSNRINTKQATLVSGSNIRTINSNSLLGSTNIAVQATISNLADTSKYVETGETSAWDKNSSNDLVKTDTTSLLITQNYTTAHGKITDFITDGNDHWNNSYGYITGISANYITESMLKATNSPTDEYVLTYEGSGGINGDLEWQVSNSTIGDTSDYTITQLDSLLTLAGTAKQKSDSTALTGYATQYDLSQVEGGTTDTTFIYQRLAEKQATLVNQSNIKSINNTTLLGSGNMTITGSVTTAQQTQLGMMWAYLALDTTAVMTSFDDSTGATVSTLTLSYPIGIDANDVVRIRVDSATYRVYSNGNWQPWTAGEQFYKDVDSAQVRHYSGGTGGTTTNQTMYVSNDSDVFSITTTSTKYPPPKPTNLVATASSSTQIELHWDNPTHTGLDSVRIYEGSANDSTNLLDIARVYVGGGAHVYSRTGRTANTTYWYGLKAVDTGDTLSAFSNIDSAKTPVGGVSPIATLDFEENSLRPDWTSCGDSSDFSVSTAAKYSDTYGMRITAGGDMAVKTLSNMDSVYVTFMIKIPDVSFNTGAHVAFNYFNSEYSIFGWQTSADSSNKAIMWLAGDNWAGRGVSLMNISRGVWHKVKIYYSNTGGGGTSKHGVWIDDADFTYSGWTNGIKTSTFTAQITSFNMGLNFATLTDYIYVDDIKIYDEDPD